MQHDTRPGRLETCLERLKTRLVRLDTRLVRLDARLGRLKTRLGRLETRPARLDTRLRRLETRLSRLNARLGHLEAFVRMTYYLSRTSRNSTRITQYLSQTFQNSTRAIRTSHNSTRTSPYLTRASNLVVMQNRGLSFKGLSTYYWVLLYSYIAPSNKTSWCRVARQPAVSSSRSRQNAWTSANNNL